MRRRKISKHLCTAAITAAAIATGAITAGAAWSIWPASGLKNYPGLEIEYLSDEEIKQEDPPVIVCETGFIERTHEVKINEFTFEEAQALMKLATAEAGNQGEDGMWLVMSTVLNRRSEEDWPDSILDVIYEHHKTKDGRTIYQFETVSNGMIDRVEISQEAHDALARIEKGEVAPQIIAFENKRSEALDKYFMPAFEHRDHRFYTKK